MVMVVSCLVSPSLLNIIEVASVNVHHIGWNEI